MGFLSSSAYEDADFVLFIRAVTIWFSGLTFHNVV